MCEGERFGVKIVPESYIQLSNVQVLAVIPVFFISIVGNEM